MPDPRTVTIADHEFTIHTWSLSGVVTQADRGEILLDPLGVARSLSPGFIASSARFLIKTAVEDGLDLYIPIAGIVLNDRRPDTGDTSHPGRYALINGNHIIAAAAAWFNGRVYVPATWFPPDAVAQTTPATSTELPQTCMGWLTDVGRELIYECTQVPVAVGTCATVDDERAVYIDLNRMGGRPPQMSPSSRTSARGPQGTEQE